MKWDVVFNRATTGVVNKYSADDELNVMAKYIDANSESEALDKFIDDITELMNCNCLDVVVEGDSISVFEPSDLEFIEKYSVIQIIQCTDE